MSEHQTPPDGDDELREIAVDETPVEDRQKDDPEVEARRRRAEMLDGVREVRRFNASDLEMRETSDGMLRFSGYASVTERDYEVADFEERIARGAFKRTLSESPDVVLMVNHGEGGSLPLARTKSGTMTLVEDSRGLRVDADLNPDDPDVRALLPKMQRGDVDEMSFAFRVTGQEWSEDRSHRLIRSVALHKGDVSIVTYGANDASHGGIAGMLRSVEDELVEMRSGKTLSAKTRSELQAAKDTIDGLLSSADKAPEAPEEDPSPSELAADAVAASVVEDGERAAEPADAKVIVIPDHTTRARERLAQLRRVA